MLPAPSQKPPVERRSGQFLQTKYVGICCLQLEISGLYPGFLRPTHLNTVLALVTLESEEGSGAGLGSEQRVMMGDVGGTYLLRTVYTAEPSY